MFEKVFYNMMNLGSGIPLFHFSAESNNLDALRHCLNTNRNSIDQYDQYGKTPLHRAILGDCPESIVLLLEAGANPNFSIQDPTFQRKPVELACRDKSTLQILVFYGASVEGINFAPKGKLIQFDNLSAVDFLREVLKKKANFDALRTQAATEISFEQRAMCYYEAACICFEFAQNELTQAYFQHYCHKSLGLLEQAEKLFENWVSEDKNELGGKIFCLLGDISSSLHKDEKAKVYSSRAATYLANSAECIISSLNSSHSAGNDYTELRRRKGGAISSTELEPLVSSTERVLATPLNRIIG